MVLLLCVSAAVWELLLLLKNNRKIVTKKGQSAMDCPFLYKRKPRVSHGDGLLMFLQDNIQLDGPFSADNGFYF